jgi:hypothetical protein
MESLAKKVAEDNGAKLVESGVRATIMASPRVVIRRTTFESIFGNKPIWERDGFWRGLSMSRDGDLVKLTDEEIVIQDP